MYSTRKLSDPHDKLTALSSVASYFATAGSESYAAGLWMADYVDQLSWIARGRARTSIAAKKRPEVWRAPSWSWASLDSNIAFRSQLFEGREILSYLQPQIINWQVEPVSQLARFGQLKSASLQMRGRVLKSRPHQRGEIHELKSTEATERSKSISDLGPGQLFFDMTIEGLMPAVSTIEGNEPWDDFVYCLLISIAVTNEVAAALSDNITGIEDDMVEELFCLALRQRSDGKYYRVGNFIPNPDYRSKGWIKAFEQAEETVITIV
jgi:hypothetical protein